MPIAPLGRKVVVHVTPKTRSPLQALGQASFNVSRAINRHQCYTVSILVTRALCASDSLSRHPIEELTTALGDIERALLCEAETPALAKSRRPMTDAVPTMSGNPLAHLWSRTGPMGLD